MMNNKDLLTVAKGMGLDAHIYKDLHEDGDFVKLVVIKTKYSIYNFNPTEGELMIWLLDHGYFTYQSARESHFLINDGVIYKEFKAEKNNLKENLLNITLQVINNE